MFSVYFSMFEFNLLVKIVNSIPVFKMNFHPITIIGGLVLWVKSYVKSAITASEFLSS